MGKSKKSMPDGIILRWTKVKYFNGAMWTENNYQSLYQEGKKKLGRKKEEAICYVTVIAGRNISQTPEEDDLVLRIYTTFESCIVITLLFKTNMVPMYCPYIRQIRLPVNGTVLQKLKTDEDKRKTTRKVPKV